MSAISVGVAALVAINGFTANLRGALARETRSLYGADLGVTSRTVISPELVAQLDSAMAGEAADRAEVTSFSAMAYVPGTTGARLVEVNAIGGGYPFYGDVVTEPAGAWRSLADGHSILADPALLTSLEARLGDTVSLGNARFRIVGTVTRMPGDAGIRALFGPRVWISASRVEETGLLQFGSRVERALYFRLPATANAATLADNLRDRFRPEGLRVRTAQENQENLTDALTRLSSYLGLVALIALLLGGLGVASAVHVFIRRKLAIVAILRCLGATARQVIAIYLIQALAMGILGSAAGVGLGVLLQGLLPRVLADFLPVAVSGTPSWPAVLMGLAIGAWVAFVFSLLPLLSVRHVPPLAALREVDPGRLGRRDPWRVALRVLIAVSVTGLAMLQADRWQTGIGFALGIGIVLGLLGLTAFGLVRMVRRWFPRRLPYLWRQGIANLYRPANQTLMVVLALGFGAFLLATLFLVQQNLLRELRLGGGGRPNLVLFDIQPNQRDGVDSLLQVEGLRIETPVPIVPMRIANIRGRSVTEWLADTTRGEDRPERWALRREYRSTWRDTLVRSEQSVGGTWPVTQEAGGLVPVSMEVELAGDLGVGVGDPVDWDVQGVVIHSRVAGLREVDWARFEPNFFVVFPSGVLEAAPHSYVTLTRVADSADVGRIQRAVVERFPNVASIDIRQVQATIEGLLGRVSWAIRFMAFFSLVTGAIVLVGAMATSRWQRLREGVLLRALGATRGQVLRVMLVEFGSLGVLAILVGMVLATAAAWALVRFVFDSAFTVPWGAFSLLAAAILAVTTLTGLWNSGEVLRRTPLEVLRTE